VCVRFDDAFMPHLSFSLLLIITSRCRAICHFDYLPPSFSLPLFADYEMTPLMIRLCC